VVLLVAVTGLALGFTRLDAVRREPPAPPAAVAAPPADTSLEDGKKLRQYLDEFLRFLEENEATDVPYVRLPPLHELPPLPPELLPETTTAELPTDGPA
jgi:hypothetical protein